jgi:putative endopeptidase
MIRNSRSLLVMFVLASAGALPAADGAPGTPGLDLAGMDREVAPGDDFFRFANGTWLEKTAIPADRSSWGSFAVLAEETSRRTAELIRGAGEASGDADARKVADFYAAFMDEAAIEQRRAAPLAVELEAIAALADRRALARHLGERLRADVDPLNATDLHTDRPFGLWVSADLDDPTRNVGYLLQGGLDMPDRENYRRADERSVELQAKFRGHVAQMLELAGFDDASARAERAYALERKIADAHASRVDSSDVHQGHNPWRRTEFADKAPGLDWDAWFEAAGLAGEEKLIVWQPGAVAGISALVASEPLATWQEYLAFHAVDRAAAVLPKRFDDARFAFHGTALTGATEQRARWKRAVGATEAALGDAVGKLYVARWFPPEAKAAAEEMVANIVAAFGRRIDRLEWMTPATRARARAKLGTLQVGIGYPGTWRDYSKLAVARDDAFGNAERAERDEYRRSLAKLGTPVDKAEWWMTPQTVNAVNLPLQNAMNFPAAILEPPFFDAATDPAQNYGGIGTVIGHEISHSFDDQGSQFDEHGKLANWWTDEDRAHFDAAAARLVAQYGAYEPLPGVRVDGELTLGENIADVAGVAAAFDGYRSVYGGEPGPSAQGFTGDQRFLISFAQIWRGKLRDAALRNSLRTNGHSPGEFRALTVRNLDGWYVAFGVEPGAELYLAPAQRVRIW